MTEKEDTSVELIFEDEGLMRVECGAEYGFFDKSRFGPGGTSRCIRFREQQYISPIELEALAGKKTKNWKFNLRISKNFKSLKTLFDQGLLKACPRDCVCNNCEIGRKFPTDLEVLIETVYKNNLDLSRVKVEILSPVKDCIESVDKSSHLKDPEELVKGNVEASPMKSNSKENDSSSDPVVQANDVVDEFCTSPDPSPKKVAKRKSSTSRLKRASPRKNLDLTTLSNLIDPSDLKREVPPLMVSGGVLEDEMVVVATPEGRKKKQQDIRAFLSPTVDTKTDDFKDIEIVEAPAKDIPQVDLTFSPEKSAVTVAAVNGSNKSSADIVEEKQSKDKENKENHVDESPSKSPRDISIRRDTLVRHTRGMRLQDRTEIVKQKHALSRNNSRSGSEESIVKSRPTIEGSTATPEKIVGSPNMRIKEPLNIISTKSATGEVIIVSTTKRKVGRPSASPTKGMEVGTVSPTKGSPGKVVLGSPTKGSPGKAASGSPTKGRVGRPPKNSPPKEIDIDEPMSLKEKVVPVSPTKASPVRTITAEGTLVSPTKGKVGRPPKNSPVKGTSIISNMNIDEESKSLLNENDTPNGRKVPKKSLSDQDILKVLEEEKAKLNTRTKRSRNKKEVNKAQSSPSKNDFVLSRRNLKRKHVEMEDDGTSVEKEISPVIELPPKKRIRRNQKVQMKKNANNLNDCSNELEDTVIDEKENYINKDTEINIDTHERKESVMEESNFNNEAALKKESESKKECAEKESLTRKQNSKDEVKEVSNSKEDSEVNLEYDVIKGNDLQSNIPEKKVLGRKRNNVSKEIDKSELLGEKQSVAKNDPVAQKQSDTAEDGEINNKQEVITNTLTTIETEAKKKSDLNAESESVIDSLPEKDSGLLNGEIFSKDKEIDTYCSTQEISAPGKKTEPIIKPSRKVSTAEKKTESLIKDPVEKSQNIKPNKKIFPAEKKTEQLSKTEQPSKTEQLSKDPNEKSQSIQSAKKSPNPEKINEQVSKAPNEKSPVLKSSKPDSVAEDETTPFQPIKEENISVTVKMKTEKPDLLTQTTAISDVGKLPDSQPNMAILKTPVKSNDYDINIVIKKETGEAQVNKQNSPSKIPAYSKMIKLALEEMNVAGGEGCTKLEILLYILRKFQPRGNISTITTKLIQVLEEGTKKGAFLSSVSCPRVLKKPNETNRKIELKESPTLITKVKKEKTEVKLKKLKLGKSETVIIGSKKGTVVKKVKSNKKDDKEKKPKREYRQQSPRKLMEPLATICRAKKLTRYEVLKKTWNYIKTKKLQDPQDKTIIVCDDNLRKLTKCKQITGNSVMGYLKPFMEPLK